MNVSVCMATYNGQGYVAEQVASILEQLGDDDEIIVVDDCSTDDTVLVLKSIDDPRIKIYFNERNMSHVYSFERAISLASNEIIMLSDQDDRWIDGRLSLMRNALHTHGSLLVTTNSEFMDGSGGRISYSVEGVRVDDSARHAKNIMDIFLGRTNYYGCAMAFKRELVSLVLPIPRFVESHDLWIAMAANLFRSNLHLEERTLVRRVHSGNASIIQRNLYLKARARVIFLMSALVIAKRIAKLKISRRRCDEK